MAFSDFRYPDVVAAFGLNERTVRDLFADVPPVEPSPLLCQVQEAYRILGTAIPTTTAGRAHWLVAPLLADFWRRYVETITVYAGIEFAPDPAAGLIGPCAYVVSHGTFRIEPVSPVLVIELSETDSSHDQMGRCVAAMVGAQRVNRWAANGVETVYGCCSVGTRWKFVMLRDRDLTIDLTEHSTSHSADRILGILTHMLGPLPVPAAA